MRNQARQRPAHEVSSLLKEEDVAHRFRSLSVWRKAGQRAPHKPLLCLLAISKLFTENLRLIPFDKIQNPLRELLTEFGPPRKVCHPEYPFWALQNEKGIWEVCSAFSILRPANGYPSRRALLSSKAEGGFQEDVYNELRQNDELRARVILTLLQSHFPETLHEDILLSLGLALPTDMPRSNDRDPEFRERVLSAYEYRCAVCGFNVRIGQVVVALEAAHIKWHQAAGPDICENGLALCSLHHKLFDRGAFTINEARCALISEKAYGTEGFVEHLGRFHKKPLLKPNRECYRPRLDYTKWHTEQVFLAPARE